MNNQCGSRESGDVVNRLVATVENSGTRRSILNFVYGRNINGHTPYLVDVSISQKILSRLGQQLDTTVAFVNLLVKTLSSLEHNNLVWNISIAT